MDKLYLSGGDGPDTETRLDTREIKHEIEGDSTQDHRRP